MTGPRPRVVVVGGGFAGHRAAHGLLRTLGDRAEVVVINSTDYFLYLPLLPQVAGGLVEPRHVCVSLPRLLPRARVVLGNVDGVDATTRTVRWTGPEGDRDEMTYDRLVLAAGSVNKLLPIPGVTDHAHGFRGVAEAIYLRDHITRQLELAAVAADEHERAARCTFVVVGAGYTGTEVAAQGQLLTRRLARRLGGLQGTPIRWLLLDKADRLLPELDPHLSRTADRVLRRRGVDVRTGVSITEARADGVVLDTGEVVATRSLIWCVGVRPDPLVDDIDLPTKQGRLVVDEYLQVPGLDDVFAVGDCAAVPDLTRPGELCGMTAQHAERQGRRVARNVAASLGVGERAPYRHHDLGFVVDLGGAAAAANPVRVPLSGPLANAVTRAYHVFAMPGGRTRVVTDWAVNGVRRPDMTSFGLVPAAAVPLDVDRPPA